MLRKPLLPTLCCLLLAGAASAAQAECKLNKLADVPVTMSGLRPLVMAKVNGVEAPFLADSGASYSTLSLAAGVTRLHLTPHMSQLVTIAAADGPAKAMVVTADSFTFAGHDYSGIRFVSIGGGGPGTVGILGRNVIATRDVEFDLANRRISLFEPQGCGSRPLAYWDTSKPYSMADIHSTSTSLDGFIITVMINGHPMRALIDSGADLSVLKLRAAEEAGITPDSPGATPAGRATGVSGVGYQTWIAPVASFKLGDEEVKDTRLRIGGLKSEQVDMLLGADFLLSHRIYIAKSQNKIYFTYNGGPVFDLDLKGGDIPPPAALPMPEVMAVPVGAPVKVGAFTVVHVPAETVAAEKLLHGGQAQKAADAFSAILNGSPKDLDALTGRAAARIQLKQYAEAKVDADAALAINPRLVSAHLLQGNALLGLHDEAGARSAFSIAEREVYSPKFTRVEVGEAYLRHHLFPQAIAELDPWIEEHDDDPQLAVALKDRCAARAEQGQALDKALADCNRALKLRPGYTGALNGRGLVYLRLGQLDQALKDLDDVVHEEPNNHWALYARGLVRVKKGDTSAGQADMQAATAAAPQLPRVARDYGVAP
jgi:tetratricopeptide (TPR) repeat protein/predicted aspartyl protease